MSLLERIKTLFSRPDLPEKTRQLFETAKSTEQLLAGLDEVLTRNEVQLREIDREMAKLETLEQSESEKVRTGQVEGRVKRNVLYRISRLRKQLDLYEQRARIYRHNIELHMRLIGRIQEMEAMRLRGVDEQQIEQIALRFDESRERFEQTMHAAAALDTEMHFGRSREERELAALEAEILAGAESESENENETQAIERQAAGREASEPDNEGALEMPPPPTGFKAVPPPSIESEPLESPAEPTVRERAPRRLEQE